MKKKILFLGMMVGLGFLWVPCGLAMNDTEISSEVPDIYIKAINPGYVVDKKSNVGEMIEIGRKKSDAPILLAGATVGYTNSSGNYSVILEFPENSWMTGEAILLRLASSPESELATENYTKTLAFRGELELKFGETVVDRVCWTGKSGCLAEFKSAEPTSLVRNLKSGNFEHMVGYEPVFNKSAYYVEEAWEEILPSRCKGVIFSEILSYYDTLKSEQFIEFYNTNAEQVLLDGCAVRYKNKNYELSGVLGSEKYFAYVPVEFGLTKNPTNVGVVEIIDVNGEVVDRLEYPNGQRKGTAYALIGYGAEGEEIWRTTYAPTPGEENNYQEYKNCEVGKVINPETGNCVKVTTVVEKVCAEGQYLNILTGRCNKIVTEKEKTCKEGYVLNPETGRCRKIVVNDGADYSLTPETFEEKTSFIAMYAIAGVVMLSILYLVFEFRQEIGKLCRRVFRRSR